MQIAMKTFAVDDYSVTGYLYHLLLGHDIEPQTIRVGNWNSLHLFVGACLLVALCAVSDLLVRKDSRLTCRFLLLTEV
jgi:hypothetical protein